MIRITIDEARNQLRDLIRAALGGEDVLIIDDDQHTVCLAPVEVHRGKRVFGSAKGMIHMADDFDAPLEDFKEYME